MTLSLSIGAVGNLIYDPRGDRSKGVFAEVAQTPRHLQGMVEAAADQAVNGSRLAARFLVNFEDSEALENIVAPWKSAVINLEAYIPLGFTDVAGIAYYGANVSSREGMGCAVWAKRQELALLSRALERPRRERPLADGYSIEIIDKQPSEADITRLVELYDVCYSGFMTDMDADMLRSMCGANTVVVSRDNEGKIVAVVQGEAVEIDDLDIRLVERSDMATDPAHQGKGLSSACCKVLFNEVKGPRTLIYAESRANWEPVLIENARLGMLPAGRLPLHTRINSKFFSLPQVGPYGDLFPFYLPMR